MTTAPQPNLVDLVEHIFSLRSWLIPGASRAFRPTKEQRAYAMDIAETLMAGERQDGKRRRTALRFIEAETGIGKTIGYLVPVLLHAALTGKRCGVSVYTLALQNQIYGEDAIRAQRQPRVEAGDMSDLAIAFHLIKQVLPPDTNLPHVTFRRGAANYLSVAKAMDIAETLDAALLQRDDWRAFLDRVGQIASWHPEQTDLFGEHLGYGLLDTIELPAGIDRSRVAIESTHEAHRNPIYSAILANSRTGDVVIHTHAAALANAERWHALLENKSWDDDDSDSGDRPLSVVLYDEADLLEAAAQSLGHKRLDVRLMAYKVQGWLDAGDLPEGTEPPIKKLLQEAELTVAWFGRIYKETGGPADDHKPEGDGSHETHRVPLYGDQADRYLGGSSHKIADLGACVNDALTAFPRGRRGGTPQAIRATLMAWHRDIERLQEIIRIQKKTQISQKASAPSTQSVHTETPPYLDAVIALSWSPTRKYPSFETIEPFPARRLSRHWAASFDGTLTAHMDSVIFTSATLRSLSPQDPLMDIHKAFGVANNKLANRLEPAHHSPKDFGTLDAVYLAHPEAPRPTYTPRNTSSSSEDAEGAEDAATAHRLETEWLDYTAHVVTHIASLKEPALVLTSSYNESRDLAKRLTDIPGIYIQTERGGEALQEGIRALQDGIATVLMTPGPVAGQGTNIRNRDKTQLLRHVVVTKLPFPPLDHARQTLIVAREMAKGLARDAAEQKANGIMRGQQRRYGYFRFKQNLGRLFRAENDKGCLWVLDPRLGLPADLLEVDKDLYKAYLKTDHKKRHTEFFAAFPERFAKDVTRALLVVPVTKKHKGEEIVTGITIMESTVPRYYIG